MDCSVVQDEMGLTFCLLFSKIIAGAHHRLVIDEALSRSCLDKVFVGHTKQNLSLVDEQPFVDNVCAMFGQHVKYTVTEGDREGTHESSSSSTTNAFTVQMASQRAIDMPKLPSTIMGKKNKDKLFNDLVSFFENKHWEWTHWW